MFRGWVVEYLSITHETLGSIPVAYKPGLLAHSYNAKTHEVKTGESEIQSYPLLFKYKVSLGYMRPYNQKVKGSGVGKKELDIAQ